MIAELEVTVWMSELTPDDCCCMWDGIPEIIGHGEDAEEAAADLCDKLSEITWH